MVPEGFTKQPDGLYFHPQRRIFWQSGSEKYFIKNEATQSYIEIRPEESVDKELKVVADASCVHRAGAPREDRHVLIRDLIKAAQALRMPVDHLARPCALFAVFTGHKPTPTSPVSQPDGGTGEAASSKGGGTGSCLDFCARNLHLKLLRRLSDSAGPWGNPQVAAALQASCDDLDAEYLSKAGGGADGCSAVVALLIGRRLFLASVGDAAGLLGEAAPDGSTQVLLRTEGHTASSPSEMSRISAAGGSVLEVAGRKMLMPASGGTEALHVSRAFGDRAFKVVESAGDGAAMPLLVATPDVQVAVLRSGFTQFLLLGSGQVLASLSASFVTELMGKRLGRPRVASGALIQASARSDASDLAPSLTAISIYFEWSEASREEAVPSSKRPKVSGDAANQGKPSQVRCRQILVRHAGSKEPVDRVRGNKAVTRSLAEAEAILRASLEAMENSPEKNLFTQRCKAVSECSSCLKGGELAGDLGWMSRGQAHPAVEAAVFSLPVGHVSDIIESDEGLHVLWRIA